MTWLNKTFLKFNSCWIVVRRFGAQILMCWYVRSGSALRAIRSRSMCGTCFPRRSEFRKRSNVLLLFLVLSACSDTTLEAKHEQLLAAVDNVLAFKSDSKMSVQLLAVPKLSPFVFKKHQQHDIHPSLQKLLSEKWQLTGVVNSPKPKICYIRDTRDEVTFLYLDEMFAPGLWKIAQLSVKGAVFVQQKTGEKKLLRFLSNRSFAL